MKSWRVAGIVLAGLILVFFALPVRDALAVLFGWIAFPLRVGPHMTVDLATVLVSGAAMVLFAIILHFMGQSWMRSRADNPPRTWRVRSTLAVVSVLFLLFAAGIAIIGTVHQIAWLSNSDRPLYRQAVAHQRPPAICLHQIGIATNNFASTYGDKLPVGGTFKPDGDMLHSWETHILIFLNYWPSGIDMERAWNDDVNQKYFKCVIPEFINSDLRAEELEDREGYGLSHFAANNRVIGGNRSMKLTEITDGASNTLLVGEVNGNFKPWGHPINWRDPAIGINRSASQGFGGPSGSGGALFVMADGSVRFVSERISPATLKALSTPNAGDAIGDDGWESR